MMISEIKRWAKGFDYEVKNSKDKENGGYNWKHLGESEYRYSEDVDCLAKDIFNHLTKNKWIEHQKEFAEQEKNFA